MLASHLLFLPFSLVLRTRAYRLKRADFAARWRFAPFGATMLPMELAEGVILDGHYRLRQLLGRGGMGEVWEAERTRLPKLFAIKFLLALSKSEPELVIRFKREAEIASRLQHPSIVQVTDFNILPDGTAYIAMERLAGEDLRARLSRGPLSLAEVREITRQVASALSLTHAEGIVHRDLKPENIFLCREPDGALRAKVLDFGISKLQGSAHGTRDDRVLGTPGYMAPEQALGKNSSIDGRTDLFSLATIVYEMLTGKGVFIGDTLAELCTKVLYHTPPPLDEVRPEVPRSVAVAVSTALSKDPAARQAGVREFADAVVGVNASVARVSPSRPPSQTVGFSATVASDAGALPSIAARARREQANEPVPIDASDVVTRSRRPAAAASSQPARRGRKRRIVAVSSVVFLGVVGAAWLELRSQQAPAPASTPLDLPVAQKPQPPSEPDAQPVAKANLPHATDTPERTERETSDSQTRAEEHSASANEPRSGRKNLAAQFNPGALSAKNGSPTLSASASATLVEAERALAQGDSASALRLARGSMREGSSERAYLVMARAYCKQRDVGMVQAMLRNVSSAARKLVRKECQADGLTVP